MPSEVTQLFREQRVIETHADRIQQEANRAVRNIRRYLLARTDLDFSFWAVIATNYSAARIDALGDMILEEVFTLAAGINTVSKRAARTRIKETEGKPGRIQKQVKDWEKYVKNVIAGQIDSARRDSRGIRQTIDVLSAPSGAFNTISNTSRTLTSTATKRAVESVRTSLTRDAGAVGYLWVSVLDGRTTQICQGLSDKEFYYTRSGVKPLPPQHPNCRSSTLPIEKVGQIPHVEDFKTWAKDPDNQDELLESMGRGRYDLYTKGKLKIERFTDVAFEPFTLEQLRKRNAVSARRVNK